MFRIRSVTQINPKSQIWYDNKTEVQFSREKILLDKDILLMPCEKKNQTLSFSLDFFHRYEYPEQFIFQMGN